MKESSILGYFVCVQNKKNTSDNKTIREVFDSLGSIRGQIILPYACYVFSEKNDCRPEKPV